MSTSKQLAIRVLLKLNWIREGKLEDGFWKLVSMPALPPVGTHIYLDDQARGHLGIVEAERVTWCEDRPDLFELDLEAIDTGDGLKGETIDWMKSLGWTHEGERFHYPLPDSLDDEIPTDWKTLRSELSIRALKALRQERIEKFSEISEERFKGVRNCGLVTIKEILQWRDSRTNQLPGTP